MGRAWQMSAEEAVARLMGGPAPTAEQQRACQMSRAFAWDGIMGCYLWQSGPGGPEIAHSEHPESLAFWDPPGLPPPSLVVARTPCPAEDLGTRDDADDRHGPDSRAYLCRLRHAHRGQSPYDRGVPQEVTGRLSRWLGEVPLPRQPAPAPDDEDRCGSCGHPGGCECSCCDGTGED